MVQHRFLLPLLLTFLGTSALPLGFQPHIIFFLADDLGFHNVGFRGNAEIETPTIDALAKAGVVLDRHYTYQYCSPTRSSLMSGRLPIHVNVKNAGFAVASGVDIRMKTMADKLNSTGYHCHMVGKWHAGDSCPANLPINRGFSSYLGYLGGDEDHYNQTIKGVRDFWEDNGPAYSKVGQSCPQGDCDYSTYNGYQFARRAVEIVQKHDPSRPLFLYQAWQEAHTPNQVPLKFRNQSIDNELRQKYSGMVHFLDSGIKNVTDALKQRDMWDDTLIVFSADNGGREDQYFGGNNYPLRGMKFTDFEGGVRVAAFVSGGKNVISQQMMGTTVKGLIHVADWYATLATLAGADPSDNPEGVPPTDSFNMWPTITSASSESPRTRIPLSSNALIEWPHKVVKGKQGGKGWWSGPIFPNNTGSRQDNNPGCDPACLFNIEEDPGEHNDMSNKDPDTLNKLLGLLKTAVAGAFQTNSTPGYTNCITFQQYVDTHNGFAGPVCTQP